MKICSNCQTGNSDGSISCRSCGYYLSKAETIDAAETLRRDLADIDRREKRKKRAFAALKLLAACLAAAFYVFAVWSGAIGKIPTIVLVFSLVFTSIGALLLFLPRLHSLWEFFFMVDAGWAVRHPGRAEPSDLYFFRSRLYGVVLIILGVVLFFKCWQG